MTVEEGRLRRRLLGGEVLGTDSEVSDEQGQVRTAVAAAQVARHREVDATAPTCW